MEEKKTQENYSGPPYKPRVVHSLHTPEGFHYVQKDCYKEASPQDLFNNLPTQLQDSTPTIFTTRIFT